MNSNAKKSSILLAILTVCIIVLFWMSVGTIVQKSNFLDTNRQETFKIIASSENKDIEDIIKNYAQKNKKDISIEYAGTLEIMSKLNAGENYDAVLTSNSIWLYMLNDSVSVKNAKSTSINPVVFGVNKTKAEALGWVGKDVYMKDILNAIKEKKLSFNMPSVTQTNTGATAYLGFLSTLAGNPEVLKQEHLDNPQLQQDLISVFSGVNRSSGSEEFLEEMFLNGQYEAVITYESSLINMNKKLVEQGKEPLYIIYTKDGVSLSDAPFAYIDHKNKEKSDTFNDLQKYLLSDEGQKELLQTGRRVWYGGINQNVDKSIFNPKWGIDTTKYIVPVKYPSTAVIKEALNMYQTEFRKPIHIVFCLDYSGSMSGSGSEALTKAMKYILNKDEAGKDLLQFASKDKITIIPFNSKVIDVWSTNNGIETSQLISNIEEQNVSGGTNIYDSSIKALEILSKESDAYNVSVVLMTDGMSNYGSMQVLKSVYSNLKKEIPIYSIMFGEADSSQLANIASLTNAKVFDGRTNLLEAFKQVRGYN